MVDIMKNISVQDLGQNLRMVKHTNGSYIIYNSTTNQIEQKGVVNPNPNPEYQHQKGSEQNRRSNNSFALEMYGLVNMISGRSDIYDNITAYPSHQHRYQMGSEQRNDNNNRSKSNAVELYELVQFIGGGNNINGW